MIEYSFRSIPLRSRRSSSRQSKAPPPRAGAEGPWATAQNPDAALEAPEEPVELLGPLIREDDFVVTDGARRTERARPVGVALDAAELVLSRVDTEGEQGNDD